MGKSPDHLTPAEVYKRLTRLRPANSFRLTELARLWAWKGGTHAEADLLSEALTRVLEGRRKWPADVPLITFLSEVMRSIADEWGKRRLRQPSIQFEGEPPDVASPQSDQVEDTVDLETALQTPPGRARSVGWPPCGSHAQPQLVGKAEAASQ